MQFFFYYRSQSELSRAGNETGKQGATTKRENSNITPAKGSFMKKIFFLNGITKDNAGFKFPWLKFMKKDAGKVDSSNDETSFSNSLAEKSYVKFVPYPESLYGEKIYIQRGQQRESIYNSSDRMESLYNSTQHSDSVIYSGKSLSSHNNVNSSEYQENSEACNVGDGVTTSSSNDSMICANRVYRPPSLFSDSRELSEAECDRYNKQNDESQPNPTENEIENKPGSSNQDGIKETSTQETKPSNEELTVILNRIYEHQDTSISLSGNENPYTSESDKSAYSINV